MSTPQYDWWPYVKGMIRRYPDLCLKEAALHDTAITANISGMPGGGKRTDKTADAALRTLPEINRRELDGVHIRRPVVMRYLWVEPDRRRDRDNIAAGRKFVQDALVRCKVLQNDGWKEIIGFSDDWAVDKARPRVEIEIIEMED